MSGKENLLMKDGSKAIFQVYEAERPRAVMLVLHGFAEHIGRYSKLAQFFNENGITICVHDQRGFGEAVFNKKRMRGVAENYSLFLDDMDVVYSTVKERYPNLPMILFGHSMGGNIALSYLFTCPQDKFNMVILETPWLRLYSPLRKRLLRAVERLGRISPTLAVRTAPGGKYTFKGSQKIDRYHYNRISFRLIAAISEAGEEAIGRAADVHIPAMLLSAEKENVVSTPAIEEFYSHAGDNMEYICIPEGRHALHNCKQHVREHAFKTMLDFIDLNLPDAKRTIACDD